jgi:4-hydroxy-tetrahydrodipicolinate synthase
MIIPPFYSSPTDNELFEHYRRVGEAVGIPIMVYNNPATANVDMTPPLLARLSQIDAVAYVKESTLEVTRIRDIIELCGDRLIPFGGILGFESFVEGASGWVAVGSNVCPRDFADLYRLTVEQGDIPAARALYHRLLPVIRMVGGHRFVSGSKAALAMMGRDVGQPRSPRLPAPPEDIPPIVEALRGLGLIGGREGA